MSIESRLDKVTPALTAKERALLVLNAWKEGRLEDPHVRRTMPRDQTNEFNRYIGLMNAANRELALILSHVAHKVEKAELRHAWLVSLLLWQDHVEEMRRAMRIVIREPITESEHAARLEAMRAEWVPVEELASLLAEEYDWQESDWQQDEEGEWEVTDEAWDRAMEEKEREIAALVAEGKLPGKGKGKRFKVQMGAFDDLLWHRAGILPQDYLQYRVLPDSQTEEVERERQGLRGLREVLDWRSFDSDPGEDATSMSRVVDALKGGIAEAMILCWIELRSIETVVSEIAAEFDGTDPFKPLVREELDQAKQALLSLQEQLCFLNVEVELREPMEEELEEMREFVGERT